jgi:hypothetical protein
MKNIFSTLIVCLIIAFFFSGCAIVDLRSSQIPGSDLSSINRLYVIHFEPDQRNLHYVIRDELIEMGFQAESGSGLKLPNDIDAIVTYEDRWFWDLANYMLQLNIEIRNPKTNYPLAVGESIRTSMARKNPDEMAREVLESIFKSKQ